MKLYDFSAYAKRRDADRSAAKVAALLPRLNEPGAVLELKVQVEGWFVLHRSILKKIAVQ